MGSHRFIKIYQWFAAAVISALIIASRKHYTVDIVVAWYTVPMVFYHLKRRWTTFRPREDYLTPEDIYRLAPTAAKDSIMSAPSETSHTPSMRLVPSARSEAFLAQHDERQSRRAEIELPTGRHASPDGGPTGASDTPHLSASAGPPSGVPYPRIAPLAQSGVSYSAGVSPKVRVPPRRGASDAMASWPDGGWGLRDPVTGPGHVVKTGGRDGDGTDGDGSSVMVAGNVNVNATSNRGLSVRGVHLRSSSQMGTQNVPNGGLGSVDGGL